MRGQKEINVSVARGSAYHAYHSSPSTINPGDYILAHTCWYPYQNHQNLIVVTCDDKASVDAAKYVTYR